MKHSEINQLLPWYANATLGEKEREIVETHLASCPECVRELETLATMHHAIRDIGDDVQPSPRLTLDSALDQIEEYERKKAREVRQRAQASSRHWITGLTRWWTLTPLWPRAIIAVQAVLLIGLGATIFYAQHRGNTYTTSSAASGDQSSTRIVVSFNENASAQQMQRAISAVHGRITDGPSALGLYTIEVPIPAERSAEIQQTLTILRQDDRVIRFAEQKP